MFSFSSKCVNINKGQKLMLKLPLEHFLNSCKCTYILYNIISSVIRIDIIIKLHVGRNNKRVHLFHFDDYD